jgi:hypothetical protein
MIINCKECPKKKDDLHRLRCEMCVCQLQKEIEKLKAELERWYHRSRHSND